MGTDDTELRTALDLCTDSEAEHSRVSPSLVGTDGDSEAPAADATNDCVRMTQGQPPGDLQEQVIANLVPKRVVHLAKGVDRNRCHQKSAMAA